jgi:hypothetical protein
MKFKFLKFLCIALSFTLVSVSNAGLINSDYLSAGDNLAAYDASQSLNWLDLSVSEGWTINNWASNVQQNEGWRLATNTEVENMLVSMFTTVNALNISSQSFVTASATALEINNFSSVFGQSSDNTRSYGLYVDEDSVWRMAGTDDFGVNRTIWGAEFGNNYNNLAVSGSNWFAMYIVKKATNVPEPSTLAIFALGMMGLASRRFKK